MGAEQPQKPKQDMNSVVFKLKMAAKRFERESKKAEKEKDANLNKAKAQMKKGDENAAKLYINNAQANIAQAQKYQSMGVRLDVMAGQLKSNSAFQSVMKDISKEATPILMQEAESMDLKDLMTNFESFNEAFDKLHVGAIVMAEGMQKMQEPGAMQGTDELMNQLRNEMHYEINKDNEGGHLVVNEHATKPVKEDTRDVDQFIEDLKK